MASVKLLYHSQISKQTLYNPATKLSKISSILQPIINRFCFSERWCVPLFALKECLEKLLGPFYPLISIVYRMSQRIVL